MCSLKERNGEVRGSLALGGKQEVKEEGKEKEGRERKRERKEKGRRRERGEEKRKGEREREKGGKGEGKREGGKKESLTTHSMCHCFASLHLCVGQVFGPPFHMADSWKEVCLSNCTSCVHFALCFEICDCNCACNF